MRDEPARGGWDAARRVLAVRLDGMGDVLMTGPAIRALRAAPGRRVTLLASPAGAEVARLMPEVDEVIVHEPPWMKATPPRATSAPDHAVIARLREGRFDAAVVFTVHTQSPIAPALLCYLADVPLRLAHCRENPYQLLTHWAPETEPEAGLRHEVRRQLDLVARVGARTRDERLRAAVPPAAARAVERLLAERGLGDGPWAVLHPGATAPSRRYPPAAYAVRRARARPRARLADRARGRPRRRGAHGRDRGRGARGAAGRRARTSRSSRRCSRARRC